MNRLFSKLKWFHTKSRFGLLLLLLVAIVWVGYLRHRDSKLPEPFVAIKLWNGPIHKLSSDDPTFQWIFLQCHTPLARLSSAGQLKPLAARDVQKTAPRKWRIALNSSRNWSDSGESITASEFVRAFDGIRKLVKSPELNHIVSVQAVAPDAIEVTLEGTAGTIDRDLKSIGSPWLIAQKSEPKNITDMLSPPCSGDFVIENDGTDRESIVRFRRNPYSLNHSSDFVQSLVLRNLSSLLSENGQKSNSDAATFLQTALNQQKFSYADMSGVASGRAMSYPEQLAYYLIANPKGLFGKTSRHFIHHAINRGEITGALFDVQSFQPMYRVVPSVFVSSTGQRLSDALPPLNRESMDDARRFMGTTDATKNQESKAKISGPIILVHPSEARLKPFVERYVARLRANFHLEAKQVTSDSFTSDDPWDLMIVSIPTDGGMTTWANAMNDTLRQMAPSENLTLQRFDHLIARQNAWTNEDIAALDGNDLDYGPLVPLGQFGRGFLLSSKFVNVSVTGDPTNDPDVSNAQYRKP
jgi:hypothetical protein